MQEKYLRMVEEPEEEAEWWLDARTRAAAEKALNLSENLTFTVYEARPLRLTRSQVCKLRSSSSNPQTTLCDLSSCSGLQPRGLSWQCDPAKRRVQIYMSFAGFKT